MQRCQGILVSFDQHCYRISKRCCCTARLVPFDVSSSQSNQRVFLRQKAFFGLQPLQKVCGEIGRITVSGQRLRISPKSLPAMPALELVECRISVTQCVPMMLTRQSHLTHNELKQLGRVPKDTARIGFKWTRSSPARSRCRDRHRHLRLRHRRRSCRSSQPASPPAEPTSVPEPDCPGRRSSCPAKDPSAPESP
jgi:hypothetical protein